MTGTVRLADAARRLCLARAGEGYDTLEHELAHALDDYDAQEYLKVQIRSRLGDDYLADLLAEEIAAMGQEFGFTGQEVEQAALKAMRRIANYADHLVKLMTLLDGSISLYWLLVNEARAEGRRLGGDGPNFETPRIKRLGEALAGIMAEVQASKPTPPVDNSGESVDIPAGHA